MSIGKLHTSHNRIGLRGPIYVAIQCGCGWTCEVSSADGMESNWDLRDAAEAMLAEHLSHSETDECRPWIRR